MKRMFCILTLSLAIVSCGVVCTAGDYNGYSTTNGNVTSHTYTNQSTGAVTGGWSNTYGNTTYHNTPSYSGSSTTNGNVTTHTYINKSTGAVTGGSSMQYGNTTYHNNYGN